MRSFSGEVVVVEGEEQEKQSSEDAEGDADASGLGGSLLSTGSTPGCDGKRRRDETAREHMRDRVQRLYRVCACAGSRSGFRMKPA
jgi:hypothetical protein